MKRFKYAHNSKNKTQGQGRRVNPLTWKHGPDPFTHECYYAYLKHRSQALYRKEGYDLTFEQWQQLWPQELFEQRGRSNHSLVLTRLDWDNAWSEDNVRIVTRKEHLKLSGSHRKETGRVRKK